MHPIMRFYLKHCLIGFAVAGLFVATLLTLNVANLRSLILGSDVGWLALLMLWIFNGIVFAGVQNGVAIMMMAEDEDGGPGSGGTPEAATVPVGKVAAPRQP